MLTRFYRFTRHPEAGEDAGGGGGSAQTPPEGGGTDGSERESRTPEQRAAERHEASKRTSATPGAPGRDDDGKASQDGQRDRQRDGGDGDGDGSNDPTPGGGASPTPPSGERPTLSDEQRAAAQAWNIGESHWQALGDERTLELIDKAVAMRREQSRVNGELSQYRAGGSRGPATAGDPESPRGEGAAEGGGGRGEGEGEIVFDDSSFYDPRTGEAMKRFLDAHKELARTVGRLDSSITQIVQTQETREADEFFSSKPVRDLGVYGTGPTGALPAADTARIERQALIDKARAIRSAEASQGHAIGLREALEQASLIRDAKIRARKARAAETAPAKPATAPGWPGRGKQTPPDDGKSPEQKAAQKHRAWRDRPLEERMRATPVVGR